MAVTKAETLVFCLRAVQKKTVLCCIPGTGIPELLEKVLYVTPRYATRCEIQAKNFLVDSALCCIAQSQLNLPIFRRICNYRYMQKLFYLLISDRSGID
jgi:hypothetical protein